MFIYAGRRGLEGRGAWEKDRAAGDAFVKRAIYLVLKINYFNLIVTFIFTIIAEDSPVTATRTGDKGDPTGRSIDLFR